MEAALHDGDCVRIPDGRVARVRALAAGQVTVRVRRMTSKTHQFLVFEPADLEQIHCPKGWMSPKGYTWYLQVTLAKMHERERRVTT